MSYSAATSDSSAAPTALAPCRSTATTTSTSIPSPAYRMAVHTGGSDSTRAIARPTKARYPSSPSERRRLSDTREKARWCSAPVCGRSPFATGPRPSSSRARNGAIVDRCGGGEVDAPICAPLSRGITPHSRDHRPAPAIARRDGPGPTPLVGAARGAAGRGPRRRYGAPSRRAYAAICSRVCKASFSMTLRT